MLKTARKNYKRLKNYKEVKFQLAEIMQGLIMTSFELFRLILKFNQNLDFFFLYIFIFLSPKIVYM